MLYTVKAICYLNAAQKRLLSCIPTHIQSLIWFNIDPKTGNHDYRIVYASGSPHFSWNSQWLDESNSDALPTTGYFFWIFWDAAVSKRYYACLSSEEMKGILYESSCKTYNDLYFYHPRALLARLKRFIHTDSIVQRKDHAMLELLIPKTASKACNPKTAPRPSLKQFQQFDGLEDCLYMDRHLTGAAIQWLSVWIHDGLETLAYTSILSLHPITIIDCYFEERTLAPDEFLFP